MGMVPEPHKNSGLIVKFFKRDGNDYVSLQSAGNAGEEAHKKVTPNIIHEYPAEWDAYVKGFDLPPVVGTPLTEIPGFTEELDRFYRAHGISVCEQFAEASDATCQKLGMGVNGFRKMARIIVENNKNKGSSATIDATVKAAVEAALAEERAKKSTKGKVAA